MRPSVRKGLDWLTGPVPLSIIVAFVIGGGFMMIAGANPVEGFAAMFRGSLGDGLGISTTLQRAIPIVGMGVAVAVAFRAGVINIGMEGQMVLGALVGGVVALTLDGPPLFVSLAAIAAGAVAGALWGVIPALLQNGLGVPILITALLLNYPARYFSSWLIRFPLKDPTSSMVATEPFDPAILIPPLVPRGSTIGNALTEAFGPQGIPTMIGANVNWSLVVVVLVVGAMVFLNRRSRYGFESGVNGQNSEFARYSGVRTGLLNIRTLALSGGLAGLFGVMLIIGAPNTRMIDGAILATNYAWTGLLVALLASYRPVGVALAGLFFGAIITGSAAVGRELAMSPQIAAIIQALVIILLAVRLQLPKSLRIAEEVQAPAARHGTDPAALPTETVERTDKA